MKHNTKLTIWHGKTLVCAGLFLICLQAMGATEKAKRQTPAPSYKNVILRAQEMILNQDRLKAAQLLVQEIEKEHKNPKIQAELKKELLNLSEIFLTEKSQRIFELGRSLSLNEPDAGIEKYKEAVSLEPGNLRILKELARGLLYRGDCNKALDVTKEALLQNPYNVDFFLIRIQAKVCMGKIEDFDAELENPFIEKEQVINYIETAKAQHLIAEEKYPQALLALSKIKQNNFPEAYYWRGLAKSKLGQSPATEYSKYVELCKESKSKLREVFPQEPRVCKEAKVIEQTLEQLKTEGSI